MTSPTDLKLRLYELALEDGRSASPFVWRIRYALAHKGLGYETVSLGFTEIAEVFGGRFKTVPVLEHGATQLAESWDIAEYLERAFPERPRLFKGPEELAMTRLMDAWFSFEVLRKMFRVYVKDVHDAARPHGEISVPRRQCAELRRLHRFGRVLLGCQRQHTAAPGPRRQPTRLAGPGLRFVRRNRARSAIEIPVRIIASRPIAYAPRRRRQTARANSKPKPMISG